MMIKIIIGIAVLFILFAAVNHTKNVAVCESKNGKYMRGILSPWECITADSFKKG
jgi:hypothetical protein